MKKIEFIEKILINQEMGGMGNPDVSDDDYLEMFKSTVRRLGFLYDSIHNNIEEDTK